MKMVVLGLLGLIVLLSCTGGGATYMFYVVIKPNEATRFITAFTTIAKEDGLETAVSQVKSDTGQVYTIMEGRRFGIMTLWSQNALLSGREDATLCGKYPEPYPDPAQFMVFTQPRLLGSKAAAVELGKKVVSQLRKSGFDVRLKQPICGAAAIHDRS